MLKLFIAALLSRMAFSAWVGEEYWTTVGLSGQLLYGRTTADFARLDDDTDNNLFVAFWMTRSRYPGEHFESFGYASVRPDGRVCGWFAGLNREPVEVCGGFRVLSIPPYRRGSKVFEWVHAYHADFPSTVGFHDHRMAKFETGNGNITYGDAKPKLRSFSSVQVRARRDVMTLESNSNDYSHVSLLRLMVAEEPPARHAEYVERERREESERERERLQRELAEERERVEREKSESIGQLTIRAQEPAEESSRRTEDVPSGESTIFVPKQLIRDQFGSYYEKQIVDGRAYYYPYDISQLANAIINPSLPQQPRTQQIGERATNSEQSQFRVNLDVARSHSLQRHIHPHERSSIEEVVHSEERDSREENYRIGLDEGRRDDRRSLDEGEE